MGRHKEWRPDIKELAELCKTKTTTQIAVIYDKDTKVIQKWLREYHLTAAKYRKVVDMPYAIRLADAGVPQTEIAELFGISKKLLNKRLQEAGWKKPTHDVENPRGVNCMDNPKISEKCMYGSGSVCMYVCYGNGRRPCPANDCTVYKPRGKRIDPFRGIVRLDDEEI